MNGKQQLIAAAGVALILGNLVTNRANRTGSASILQSVFSPNADTAMAHEQFMGVATEVLGLLVLLILAGLSSTAASIGVVFILGLAAVWLITWLSPNTLPGTYNSKPGAVAAA